MLSKEQVKSSPDIDTHQPITRQHELEYMRHYSYPDYWNGGELWGMGAYPFLPPVQPSSAEIAAANVERQRIIQAGDRNLRSSEALVGYEIQASDESIGHVEDFVFDDESWSIRYLVVDTRNWWPGGKKVLVATRWIDRIDWVTQSLTVKLTRKEVKNSPDYHEALPIARDYEKRLHDAYHRQGYWE